KHMRKWIIALAVSLVLIGYIAYFRWSSFIRQPYGFSHARHVQQGISCQKCHPVDALDSRPAGTLCKNCHQDIHVLSQVRWIPVYRLAPDIIFSHQGHQKVECTLCHPEMTSPRRWVLETHYTMKFCMDCHALQGAKNECGTCHKNR